MQLTLANHPITDLQFGSPAHLNGTVLTIDKNILRRVILEDQAFASVEFERSETSFGGRTALNSDWLIVARK